MNARDLLDERLARLSRTLTRGFFQKAILASGLPPFGPAFDRATVAVLFVHERVPGSPDYPRPLEN